jgi:hypothetical protein
MGRLAKRRVEFGNRLLDGRVHVTSTLPSDVSIVISELGSLIPGRAARATISKGG